MQYIAFTNFISLREYINLSLLIFQ